MPKHTLYFPDRVYARLDIDPSGIEGLSGRVTSLCLTALDTMRDSVPELPLNEWQALLDISNGHHREIDRSVAEQVESFRFSVSESGPECNDKWDVSCVDLARKLAAMPMIAQCAVMEVCRRFWVRKDINGKYDNYLDILLAHGAKIGKPAALDKAAGTD